MTGKRFRTGEGIFIDYPSEAIIDKNGERYYDGIKPNYVSSKEICSLLNDYDKTIQNLEKELFEVKKELFEVKQDTNRLIASNKDLRLFKKNVEETLQRHYHFCLPHDDYRKQLLTELADDLTVDLK